MPEGPELFLSSLYINRTCGGLIFSGKVYRNPIHKCQEISWNESAYTISAESKGKELMLHLRSHPYDTMKNKSKQSKECTILFTFGMSGKFEYTAADSMPKHSHLIFYTESEPKMGLAFVDYRRFGKWVEGGQWSDERGPCVIQDHHSFIKNVAANLNNSAFNKPICEVLLNQKFFNGIGNYLRAEILFRCKVPPFEKARNVLKLKEPKEEPVESNAEQKDIVFDEKIIKGKKVQSEARKIDGSNSEIKVKVEISNDADNNEASIDLFVPKAQQLLELCGSVPLEVIDIGSTKYSLSELYKDDSEGKSFNDWLQCYYQEGMKNMADHNNRTIWFSGPAGAMVPTVQKVRGTKKKKSKKVDKEAVKSDIDQQEFSSGQDQEVRRTAPSTKLTRKKLKEHKEKTSNAKKGKKNGDIVENPMASENKRKRKKDAPCDPVSSKKSKRGKSGEGYPTSKRLTRSSLNIEQ